jgi:hypothetical protein
MSSNTKEDQEEDRWNCQGMILLNGEARTSSTRQSHRGGLAQPAMESLAAFPIEKGESQCGKDIGSFESCS